MRPQPASLAAELAAAERTALWLAQGSLRVLAGLVALGAGAAPGAAAAPELSPRLRRRIRLTVWRLQQALGSLEAEAAALDADELREALSSLAYLLTVLRAELLDWIEIVDVVVEEAERCYGTGPGRGRFKREQAKAAMLYKLRRARLDLPAVPGFLEPVVFSVAAEILIDFVVGHLNANDLWDRDAMPRRPETWRRRFGTPAADRLGGALSWLGRALTWLSWRLIMRRTRLSPRLRALIDAETPELDRTLAALDTLGRFAVRHRAVVLGAVQLLSIATQQAEGLVGLSGAQKQAYARELILAFLEQNGFVPPGGLWRQAVAVAIEVAIDMTVALFNRRRLFGQPGPPVDAAA